MGKTEEVGRVDAVRVDSLDWRLEGPESRERERGFEIWLSKAEAEVGAAKCCDRDVVDEECIGSSEGLEEVGFEDVVSPIECDCGGVDDAEGEDGVVAPCGD